MGATVESDRVTQQSTWAKVKAYTKLSVAGVVTLYVLIVLLVNWDSRVQPGINVLFVRFDAPRILTVLLVTAVGTLVLAFLTRLVYRTLRQIADFRRRSRSAQLERDMAEMKAKADRLQTTDNAGPNVE